MTYTGSENIGIRRIGIHELNALRELSIRTFSEAYLEYNSENHINAHVKEAFSKEQLSDELNNENSRFYFAFFNGQKVGYLKVNCGTAQTDLRTENALEIERIYVLDKFQGKKIGNHLFIRALKVAKSKNVDFIWLGVWEENRRAIEFYRKLGFSEFDSHVFMLGDDPQLDVLMKRDIKSHTDPL